MTKPIDLTKFNAVAEANEGGELELFFKGESTNVFLHVLGKNSDAVRAHVKESLKDFARKNAMAEKRGEQVDFQVKLLDKFEDRNIDNALVRITGWTGQSGEFSKEVMRGVLECNPQWVDDVMEFSDFLDKQSMKNH